LSSSKAKVNLSSFVRQSSIFRAKIKNNTKFRLSDNDRQTCCEFRFLQDSIDIAVCYVLSPHNLVHVMSPVRVLTQTNKQQIDCSSFFCNRINERALHATQSHFVSRKKNTIVLMISIFEKTNKNKKKSTHSKQNKPLSNSRCWLTNVSGTIRSKKENNCNTTSRRSIQTKMSENFL
jgi:hypothetical protein